MGAAKWLLLVGVLALFGTGCGDDCESTCDALSECDGADSIDVCVEECEEDRDEAADAGCESEFDDLMACVNSVDDICDGEELNDECTPDAFAFFGCTSTAD